MGSMMMEEGFGLVKRRPEPRILPLRRNRRGFRGGPGGRFATKINRFEEGAAMPFHHVAITTRDPDATHAFYTQVMGFSLVRVEAGPAAEGGWARHLFYDTGGGECLAVWDLHDNPAVPAEFATSISRGLGLPSWTDHL